jgi:DNA-binding IscR family transcriptional regulator
MSNSVYDIITTVEGSDIYSRCVLDLTRCDAQNPCPLHSFITDSMSALKANFKEVSLSDVAQRGQL